MSEAEQECPLCPDDLAYRNEQAKIYGGWCKHWCSKCGYACSVKKAGHL